jgi:hypothetical protein
MPPFLAFRMWLREGPLGERTAAGITGLIVVGVLIAALVPVATNDDNSSTLITTGQGAPGGHHAVSGTTGRGGSKGAVGSGGGSGVSGVGGTGGGSTLGGGGSTGGVGTSSGHTGGGNGGGSGGHPKGGKTPGKNQAACGSLSASAPGVTATTVTVDIANLSLAGPIGNSTFHVRPDLTQIENALADDINKHGGVACGRKLLLKQYAINPLDANDGQSKCLQMAGDHPFMVFNFGAYLTPAARRCFVQEKLLEQAGTQIDQAEARSSYPYLFSPTSVAEQMVDAAISGFAKRGVFKSAKFKKIGLFEDACDPPVNKEISAALARAGVKSSQISTYVLDCSVASPPNQIEQAVVQQRGAGVTHVLLASSETNDQNYVRLAGGQFHPAWLVSDYGSNTSGAGTTNWGSSFNGAQAITTTRVGELSSGIHNPQERKCDRTLRSHNVRGVTSENSDTSALDLCDMFGLFRQALNGAGDNPTQQTFLQSLGTMGLFRSAVVGDGNFNQAGKVTGGDFAREVRFSSGCSCWRVVDRTMRPLR